MTWIIPKNLQPCLSAQEVQGLNLDLNEQAEILEQSCMWRSKPSQSRTWYKRLNQNNWMQHLSGRISKPYPELQKAIAEKLTSSLVVIPASPSVTQGSGEVRTTHVIYGLTSGSQSTLFGQDECSSRTSKDMSRLDSIQSLQTWQKMVTDARGDYSARQKSARHTNEKEFSSWGSSGTPNTMDFLPSRSYEAMKKQATNGQRKNRTQPGNLREQIDPSMRQAYKDAQKEANPLQIGSQAQLFPLQDQQTINISGKNPAHYPTPKARDWKGRAGRDFDINAAVNDWPTPTTAEAGKISNQPNYGQQGLSNHYSIQGTPKRKRLDKGAKHDAKSNKQLNPAWVSQLMGLPPNWIELDSRIDKLRMLGNGIVPHQAEKAFIELSKILEAA